jgi:hypothetical protein
MRRILVDEIVETDYGQLDIGWADGAGFDGDPDRFFKGQVNGLVGAGEPGGLYLVLARRSGGSHVEIVVEEGEPSDPEVVWEDVVEVSVNVPAGSTPEWSSWGGESGGELDLPGGEYRVRVSARGRDAGSADEFADGVVDRYLIEFWQASLREDAILRTTSADASYWHREWGSRR